MGIESFRDAPALSEAAHKLPYDAVRGARDLDSQLLGFLQETYAAVDNLAQSEPAALELRA